MKYSVCIDPFAFDPAVFGTPVDRFVPLMEQVKEAGFEAFEFWLPGIRDLEPIRVAKERLGLETAAFCTAFVNLCDVGRRDEYLAGLKTAIEQAKRLDCPTLISQAGWTLEGVPHGLQRANLLAGLRAAAPLVETAGLTLAVEPLNTRVDHPGYFLPTCTEGLRLVEEVGSPAVKILFDLYHQQIMEGNLIPSLTEGIGRIAHFHAAGHPGRHEITTGEVRYEAVFAAIEATGYAGFVGLEYFPLKEIAAGLREARELIGRTRT